MRKIGIEMRSENQVTQPHITLGKWVNKSAQVASTRVPSLSYPSRVIARRFSELDVALVLVIRPDHLQRTFTPLLRKSPG